MTAACHPPVVLCVDDDIDDLEILSAVIKIINPRYQVVEAQNGVEASQFLLQAKSENYFPCLIILDVNMPQMNGKETLLEIKKDIDLSKIPVVVYTTSANTSDKAFFLRYKVDMVTKPDTMNSILIEVQKLLTHCREFS